MPISRCPLWSGCKANARGLDFAGLDLGGARTFEGYVLLLVFASAKPSRDIQDNIVVAHDTGFGKKTHE
jgi:hypothetical protein